MRTAWGVSLAAQALLLAALWHSGRRDWWTASLAAGLVRSAVLWPLAGIPYFWVWLATEPIMAVFQIAAAREATEGSIRSVQHIGLIAAASAFVHAAILTSDAWPTPRRAALLLRQGTVFTCVGLLSAPLVYGGPTDHWMLAYSLLNAARTIAEQVTTSNSNAVIVSHLWAVAFLFCGWSIYGVKRGDFEPNA